jgi:hypothetical protein
VTKKIKWLCTNPKHEWFTYNDFPPQGNAIQYRCITCKKKYVRDDATGDLYDLTTKAKIYEGGR